MPNQTQSPNITRFLKEAKDRGIDLEAGGLNEDRLAAAYSEGRPLNLKTITFDGEVIEGDQPMETSFDFG